MKQSTLGEGCVVGNFSRVDYTELAHKTRIDRNNHIFQAKLGRFSYTGINTVIMHATIGDFTSISWNVSIGGADHDYQRMTQHSFLYSDHDGIRPPEQAIAYDRFTKPITIGSDVWIAAGAVITRGVTIGHGAAIGANAVITRDVEPYTIVVGAPAKAIKKRFSDEIIAALLELQWWNWPVEKIKQHYDLLANKPELSALQQLLRENKND
ncbi:DapH/DapD/GlmU-related protein [Pseudidiomarina insulisalsae]|uniref:CatB-related O-acetyltransferase n=1 Tax=Pseudidiomarina insulisalsae TaxID=575789 RepID=UPI00130068C0